MAKSEVGEGKINGLIDKGCSMEGKLTFDGAVQINGDFRGDIVSDGILVVGPEATVEGTVKVGTMIVEGSVEGTVEIKKGIELRRSSKLVATLSTPSIMIEEGALFHGQCEMLSGSDTRKTYDNMAASKDADSSEDSDSLMI